MNTHCTATESSPENSSGTQGNVAYFTSSRTKNYVFDLNDAIQYKSADIAAIVHSIRYWLDKNRANCHNINNGRVWTYNTLDAWAKLFPWMSKYKIERILKKLENDGFILKGNFNKNSHDRTTWYTLNESDYILGKKEPEAAEFTILQNCNMRDTKILQNRNMDVAESQYVYRYINTDRSSKKPAAQTVVQSGFNFDLILAWIITQFEKLEYHLDESDRIFIRAALQDYIDRVRRPNRSTAYSWVEQALIRRFNVSQRSQRNSEARDRRTKAVVAAMDTTTATIEQQAVNNRPRTLEEKLTDTSWADGVFDDER